MDRHPLVITRHWDGSVHVRGLMPDQQVTTLPDGGLEISQVPAPVPQVLQLIQTPGTYLSLSMYRLWKLDCARAKPKVNPFVRNRLQLHIATKEEGDGRKGRLLKTKASHSLTTCLLSLGRQNLRAETRF